MPTFELKQIDVPLFGVVEIANKSAWLNAFSSAGKTIQVQFGDTAMDIIASELELDAEGLAADAARYVDGKYRPKARGLSGGSLGVLGEILTFLVNQGPGRELVRVVSSQRATGQAIKGSRFPRPDFILMDASGLSALEVKSTEPSETSKERVHAIAKILLVALHYSLTHASTRRQMRCVVKAIFDQGAKIVGI